MVFLGHVLSAEGISANPKKVEKIKNWLVTTNPKELQSFLGFTSYYHHFTPRFAAITKCLHQLVGPANHPKIKKNKKNNEPRAELDQDRQTFIWTGKHQDTRHKLDNCKQLQNKLAHEHAATQSIVTEESLNTMHH